MEADAVIIEPVLTEKTNAMMEGDAKKYVFKVHPSANKAQIRKAVHELFDVNPTGCHIINVKPKPRSARTRSGFRLGHTTPWKKAVVSLPRGERIDVFEAT